MTANRDRRDVVVGLGGAAALAITAEAVAQTPPSGGGSRPLHGLGAFDTVRFGLENPAKVAVIVIDMQHLFVTAPGAVPYAAGIAPAIDDLVAAVRRGGGTVAWTRASWGDGPLQSPPAWYSQVMPREALEQSGRGLRIGARGHAIIDELSPQPEDVMVDKYRFSAFVNAETDLHRELSRRGIDTLIVTGTLTRFCCGSTARDAMMRDYRVLMPPDATADRGDREHNGALADLASMGLFDLRRSTDLRAELVRT